MENNKLKEEMENQLMTEQEFIAKFKENGFELYKTEDLKPKLDVYYKIEENMDKKLNGFNNGRDATDGVGSGESLEENMKWCAENMKIKKEKTMFEEMEAQGSNIPNKVKYLQSHGWQSYKHHDNWVRKDLKDWEKDLCNFDLNSAYEEALREANELSNAIRVLCNALREDKELYFGYQSNIAMSFVDAVNRHTTDEGNSRLLTQEQLNHYANEAAKNFLDLLIKE